MGLWRCEGEQADTRDLLCPESCESGTLVERTGKRWAGVTCPLVSTFDWAMVCLEMKAGRRG